MKDKYKSVCLLARTYTWSTVRLGNFALHFHLRKTRYQGALERFLALITPKSAENHWLSRRERALSARLSNSQEKHKRASINYLAYGDDQAPAFDHFPVSRAAKSIGDPQLKELSPSSGWA